MTKVVKVAERQVVDGRTRREGEFVRVPDSHAYKSETVADAATLAARDAAAVAERDKLEKKKTADLTPPPVAVIKAPEKEKAGKPAEFDGSKSEGSVEIVAWYWTFGDGGMAEGEIVEYVYKRAGRYAVTLTVVDAYEHKATAEHEIVINGNGVTPRG